MPVKKAYRYLRFSSEGQSNSSIERQDIVTADWCRYNDVTIADTFIDEGHSARTFDRPDMKKLISFIAKNKGGFDYLVVSELTRFSRELGDAVNMVKNIQLTYGVRIVSAGRNAIYDCTDHTSFFMMSLEFLMGNSENLKRVSDINGGVYTAKTREGRYIGARTPFGYKKTGEGKNKKLEVLEEEAAVVRFIFRSFLTNVPLNVINKEASSMGLKKKGNSVITKILSNPIYSGQQLVKPWKGMPGGLFKANHEALIDVITWNEVQQKLKRKTSPKITVSDELYLRGALSSSCGKLFTGAASRGKMGVYYNYYKCNHCKQNESAARLHNQLNEALGYLSLSPRIINAIRSSSESLLEDALKKNKQLLNAKQKELSGVMQDLESVEKKWIANQIFFETYNRQFSSLTQRRTVLKAEIDELSRDDNQKYLLLSNNIDYLTDMQNLFHSSNTLEKQQLLNLVFDNRLRYEHGVYRTPYIMPVLSHNKLILKQKNILVVDEKKGENEFSPEVEHRGLLSNSFNALLSLIESIKVA